MSLHFARRLLLCLLFSLCLAGPVDAALEIRTGEKTTLISDVYQRDGVALVAIDEVLAALGGSGSWESASRRYLINTPAGRAVISPASSFLVVGERQVKIDHRPRFIDGRLRVSEAFVRDHLLRLFASEARLTNLAPAPSPASANPVDELIGALLLQSPGAAAGSPWVVAVDPGHGGDEAGAHGRDGTTEQEINLAVALHLQKLLKMRRADPVVLTRDGDYAVSAGQRLELLRRGNPDLLLLLHCQASFSPRPRGLILYVPPAAASSGDQGDSPLPGRSSRHLAEALRQALVSAGFEIPGLEERALLPLGQGDLPRVLVEMGYLSHPEELAALRNPLYQEKLAQALFAGLESFRTSHQSHQEPEYGSESPPAQR